MESDIKRGAETDATVHLHESLGDVRAVVFDAGGTLVHPDWARLGQLATEQTGRTFTEHELHQALKQGIIAAAERLQQGHPIPDEEQKRHWVFRRMYGALGLDDEACERLHTCVDAEHDRRHLWCGLDPDAPRVLEALKREGLRTAVISNTEDGRLQELFELVEIAGLFDFLIDSKIVGQRKPDAAIFHLALARLGLEAHEAAYVGDSYVHDALAAQAVGMRPILLDPLDLHADSQVPRIRALSELISWNSVDSSQ